MEGTLLTAAQRSEMEALVARYTATSDIADGIKNTEQSSLFIDLMREQSIVPKIAQLYKMESNTRDINAIGLAPDQLRKKTEGIAPETWVDIAVSKNTLTGVMCIYPIAITYESLLRNIEKQELEGTIDAQSAKAVMNDIEKCAWVGDTSSGNAFLNINDGLIKIAKNGSGIHITDTEGSTDQKAIFAKMIDDLPDKWLADTAALRFFCSTKDRRAYGRQIAARNDGLLYLLGKQPLQFEDIDIVGCPGIPQGTYILTPALNIAYGIELAMMVKRGEDIDRGIVKLNTFISWDVNFAVYDMVDIAYDVTP